MYKYLNGNNWAEIDSQGTGKARLADSASLALSDDAGHCDNSSNNSRSGRDPLVHRCGIFLVDLNGFKGPNQVGRDTFRWHITKQGVFPYGHYDDNAYADSTGNALCNKTGTGNDGDGYGCTAKILKESAMNY